jgi:hypothetical protein
MARKGYSPRIIIRKLRDRGAHNPLVPGSTRVSRSDARERRRIAAAFLPLLAGKAPPATATDSRRYPAPVLQAHFELLSVLAASSLFFLSA